MLAKHALSQLSYGPLPLYHTAPPEAGWYGDVYMGEMPHKVKQIFTLLQVFLVFHLNSPIQQR